MAVTHVGSREARAKWRALLDAAYARATDVIIERSGRPIAVLIAYEDYAALSEELDELRAVRRAAEAYEEWKRDPSTARPWAEIEAELVAVGLMDE